MIRRFQRLLCFKISQFKVASEMMKQTQNEEWRQKLASPTKEKLQRLYKQATQGYQKQTPYYGIKNDEDQVEFWSKHMGESKERAESDYVTYVHDILYYQDPQKCLQIEEQH